MPRQGTASAGRYRMSREGQASQRGLQGMYVLTENAGCQVYRPTWQGTRTIFRPFPGRDPGDPTKWDPFRLSEEDRDWGDWVRRYDMAFSFGVPGITFIIKDPLDKTCDDQQNPVWMLYRTIQQAVKSGQGQPSWNPLIFGATGRAAPVNAPKDGYLMQGILMEHKSKPQNPPRGCLLEHSPVVMLMSQSAGEAMLDVLSEKNEDGTWRWPDVVDLDGGRFIQFHQAGTQHNVAAAGQATQMGANMSVGNSGGGPVNDKRYEAEVLEQYNSIAPSYPGIHEVAQAHVKPWDDIVRIPTIEEQVKMLCGAGIPATAIVFALGDVYQEFIPQHIFDQARAQSPQAVAFPPTQGAAATPDAGNPMQTQGAPGGNPMAAQPTATHRDPGMPPVPPEQAVSQSSAAPAGNPMTAAPAQQPPADAPNDVPFDTAQAAPAPTNVTPEAQGFDPQPTHADTSKAQSTMDALARARARAAAAQQ